MFPSKHIYNPGTGDIMMAPSQESAIGLYFLTKEGDTINKKFDTVGALSKALDDKSINVTDMVRMAKGKTSAGRAMVDSVLPEKYRGRNQILDKKSIKGLLSEIANNDPKEYASTVEKLTDLGNQHAFKSGFTVTLDDVQPLMPKKDQLLDWAVKQSAGMNDQDKIKLYMGVDKKIKQIIADDLGASGNNLFQMVRSGARGDMNQLKQIVSTPLLVEDVTGATLPIPIQTSFSHGLGIGEYWNSLYGARRGVVDKQLQTQKPGEFNKDLMATVVKNVISENDCSTDSGLEFSIDDVDAQDRVLAQDVHVGSSIVAKKGDIITANMIGLLRGKRVNKILARSPITCKLPQGTCAKCYGLDADGRLPNIGDNVGAIAGQSMTEPLTQMVLRSMHSGGVAGAQNVSGYDTIDKLIRMPKTIVGKATLTDRSGKVSSIENAPAGGKNVFIGQDKFFVSPNNPLKVRIGTSVKRGDPLSEGIIQPRELVDLKGMLSAQQYISDEITNAYRNTGTNLKKKNVETVVRSLTNTTRVLEGGDSGFMHGDIVPYTVAESFNMSAEDKVAINDAIGKPLFKDHGPVKKGTVVGKRVAKVLEGLGYKDVAIGPEQIIHQPFVEGIKQLPMLNKDWLAQMGYGHLARGIQEGASEAWSSDIHDFSPVPSFAYGAEFGTGKKGKY
jgi:DNA-directed RNA polymerase subunit beta'